MLSTAVVASMEEVIQQPLGRGSGPAAVTRREEAIQQRSLSIKEVIQQLWLSIEEVIVRYRGRSKTVVAQYRGSDPAVFV